MIDPGAPLPSELSGKVIAITGAASGIGFATSLLAARSGAAGIVMVDRDADALARSAAEVEATGANVVSWAASVTKDGVADEIVGLAVQHFGRIDAAVNGAGIEGGTTPLDTCTDEQFDIVIDVNLRAVFRCVRAQLRQMYKQSSGSIVNISSASVFGVHPVMAPYIVSKAGVLTLSQVAAKEAGPRGVRVNAICPGLTDTPMLRASIDDRESTNEIASRIPLGRFGRPSELAEAIIWLCSDKSSFTNGTGLVVDGGRVG